MNLYLHISKTDSFSNVMDKLHIDLAKQGCEKGDEYNVGVR
jgi:hypothetical protein